MYNEENLLKPIDHIRMRPGMYIGSTDICALNTLVYDTIDMSMDEGIVGHTSHLNVTLLDAHTIRIEDDSDGIPVDPYRDSGFTFLELWISREKGTYYRETKTFGGLMGKGMSVINALSSTFEVQVKRDGYLWQQEYRQGKKFTELIQVRALTPDESTGTTITFTPDFTILETNNFDYTFISKRLRELVFLIKGLKIHLHDKRSNQQEILYAPEGLIEFVRFLNAGQQLIHDEIYHAEELDFTPEGKSLTYHIKVEFAFQYVDASTNRELSFANTQPTPNGGTHLNGFHEALHRTLNRFARETGLLRETDSNFTPKEIRKGLKVVLSIHHPHPSFESQTKIRLINPEVHGVVASVVSDTLPQHSEALQRIIEHLIKRRQTNR